MSEDILGRAASAMGGGAASRPSLLNPPATHDPRSQSRRIFLFLLFLASGVVILSSWYSGSPEVKRAERMPVGAGLGLRAIELPDGVKLEAPRRGFIDSLATAVKSENATDDEGPFIFDQLAFATGSNALAPSSKPQLEQLAAILRAFPQLFITIEGHTDNIGADVYNKKLSAQRAQAVKAELAGMGVQSSRIATVGYGASRPIVGNSSEEGRARNRRIQVAITRR